MNFKTYADSTLLHLTKKDLLNQLRCAEHNRKVAEDALAQQAENLKDWEPIKRGVWKATQFSLPLSDSSKIGYICTACNTHWDTKTNYCPFCGAEMN